MSYGEEPRLLVFLINLVVATIHLRILPAKGG
jgi:hypothetical protein